MLRILLRTLSITLIVVVLVHGPRLSDLIGRSLIQSAAEVTEETVASGQFQTMRGAMELGAARLCPPAWLSSNVAINDRALAFVPIKRKGKIVAFAELPMELMDRLTKRRLKGALPPRDPIMRMSLRSLPVHDHETARSIARQVLWCPTFEGVSIDSELSEDGIMVGELADLKIGPHTWVGQEWLELVRAMALFWGILWLLLFGIYLLRGNRHLAQLPPDPRDRRVQIRLALRRGLMIAGVLGLGIFLVMDVASDWPLAKADDYSGVLNTSQHGFVRHAGIVKLDDALLCSDTENPIIGSTGDDVELLVPVSVSPKHPVLSYIAFDDPATVSFLSWTIRRSIRHHELGFEHPFRMSTFGYLKTNHTDQDNLFTHCRRLSNVDQTPHNTAFDVPILRVSPHRPSFYRMKLIGFGLLCLMLGLGLGFLWTERFPNGIRLVAVRPMPPGGAE